MTSRAQRRAALHHHKVTGIVGHPNLRRPKETEESHARLVARIKRQIDPALLPPTRIEKEHAVDNNPLSMTLQILQEYGWGVSANIQAAMGWVQGGFSRLADLSIGLPMAEAAKSGKNDAGKIRVGQFISDLRKDFDIQKSLSLHPDSSLRGVTIIIGEDHYDDDVQAQIGKAIIQYLRIDQKDMVMLEGEKGNCKERMRFYGLPEAHCVAIEDGFPAYIEAEKALDNYVNAITKAAKSIYLVNPHLPWKQVEKQTRSHEKFVRDYQHTLPAEMRVRLFSEIGPLQDKVEKIIDGFDGEREGHMLKQIKNPTHPAATRFFVLGYSHVLTLAPTLLRLPNVILMAPRSMAQQKAYSKLPAPEHEEL